MEINISRISFLMMKSKKNKKEVSNVFHPTISSLVSTTKNIFVSNNAYREIKDWDKYIGNNKEN